MVKLIEELAKKIKSNQGFIKSSEPVFKIQFNDTRAYVSTNKKCYKYNFPNVKEFVALNFNFNFQLIIKISNQ